MFKDNILDTLIITDSKIVFKKFHIARTVEAFNFLNIKFHHEVDEAYNDIESLYAGKTQDNESLRLVFLTSTPLRYTVKIQKIQKLPAKIKLNILTRNQPPKPGAAFKWENREDWRKLLQKKNRAADDVLVINTQNEIIETSRFNIFCFNETAEIVYTPMLASGCINGVLRRFALSEGSISLPGVGNKKLIEKNLKLEELSSYKLFVGNSIRGVLKATVIEHDLNS